MIITNTVADVMLPPYMLTPDDMEQTFEGMKAAVREMIPVVAPSLSEALTNFSIVRCDKLPTMGVTKKRVIGINWEWARKLPVIHLTFILLHETFHPRLRHADRADALGVDNAEKQQVWNWAGDAKINDMLKKIFPASIPLPDGIFSSVLGVPDEDWTSEDIYHHLMNEEEEEQKQGGGDDDGGGGSDGDEDADDGEGGDDESDEPGEPGEGEGEGEGEGDDESDETGKPGEPGGGEGDEPGEPGESDKPGKGKGKLGKAAGGCGGGAGADDALDAELNKLGGGGRTEAEAAVGDRKFAEAVVAAMGAGDLPAELRQWCEEILKPPFVPWEQILESAMHSAIAEAEGMMDLTWRRNSQLQPALGYGVGCAIMPAWISPQIRILVGEDTSGSMGCDEADKQALGLIADIIERVGQTHEVHYASCDTAIGAVVRAEGLESLREARQGGGGTDMSPFITYVNEVQPPYHVLVIITDGELYVIPEKPDNCHVVWVLVGSASVPVKWGTIVKVGRTEVTRVAA